MRVGIVGLGRIGIGVARLVLEGGHDVVGYDVVQVDPAALPPGLRLATSPADAAEGADCVLIAVYDETQVHDVVTGADGVLRAPRPAPILVVLSTVGIDVIRSVDESARQVGSQVVDCGVCGGRALYEGGRLAISVGGESAAVERVRPVLEAFGHPMAYLGPLGSGMTAKLARNLTYYATAVIDWEAARLASGAGLDVEAFVQWVKDAELWAAGRMGYVSPADHDGSLDPGLRLARYAHKDLQAALTLAAELALRLPAAEVADAAFGELESELTT
jgi:3-hydroxyisobutyrate dehydrogenase-like beta-hydroxyacid dehydrogenase